jgi:DNA-binding NarL/FixJ family response regulator
MFTNDFSHPLNASATFQPPALALSELSRIWPELASGRARVVTSGATASHNFMQLAPAVRELGWRELRDIELLTRLLRGQSQKALALDLGYSPSTVATSVSGALAAMGFGCGARHVPALLVTLLHAWHGKAVTASATRIERLGAEANAVRVESARPELALRGTLSKGESEVIGLLVEGRTYVEIATRRSTSVRTVANQIASAYGKLRVSGRLELLCFLAASSLSSAPSHSVAA